jgi:uncharacterized protein YjbI with pentapeptide repeats
MKTHRTSDTDLAAPPPVHGSGTGSILRLLGPLMVLGVLGVFGYINSIGAWPAFRQQDTSILHWILASNPEALKGLTHDIKTEPDEPPSPERNGLWNLLRNYLTLENINLSGLDLSSTDFGDMSLENVSLAGARLVNSDFSCADLTRVDFSGAKLMYSRFDYSKCPDHISTKGASNKNSQCSSVSEIIKKDKSPFYPPSDPKNPLPYSCLEGTFIGADFSHAQIRGDEPQGRGNNAGIAQKNYCNHLLILVGNMSGANFNNAKLTCVALIQRPISEAASPIVFNGIKFGDLQALFTYPFKGINNPQFTFNGIKFGDPQALFTYPFKGINDPQFTFNGIKFGDPQALFTYPFKGINNPQFTFNGINFTEARLDRVSLLEGPFRFTQFERANLKGLFLNLDKADLDYSRFNEIQCKVPTEDKTYPPCLWVQRGDGSPLHLNFLWSTLFTNLKPIEGKDRFLCTPPGDLPASVEDKLVVSADYWLSTQTEMKPVAIGKLQKLGCDKTHLLPSKTIKP